MDHAADQSSLRLWLERLAVALLVAVALYALQADVANGDERVYTSRLDADVLIWNPNHLLIDPVGVWAHRLQRGLHLGWAPFTTLKVLSGVTGVMGALLFHAVLALMTRAALARIAGTIGLVWSAHFLSLAIGGKFFMIQMPFVAGLLWLCAKWALSPPDAAPDRRGFVAMGALLAVATAIMVNNVLLTAAIGVVVAWPERGTRRPAYANALWVWGAAALIVVPVFLAAYVGSGADVGLKQWMTSYQGRAGNPADALYGIEWTPGGVVRSLAMLGFGSVSSLVDLGPLGSTVKTLVSRQPIEFQIAWFPVTLAAALFLAAIALSLPFLWWFVTTVRHQRLGRLTIGWMAAYAFFNFLWAHTADQFWFQNLPVVWMLLVLYTTGGTPRPSAAATASRGSRWRMALPAFVAALVIVNTTFVASPRAFADVERRQAEFLQLLKPGDLLITTGWDDILWMRWDDEQAPYERVLLMGLALDGKNGSTALEQLPARVSAHLASGKRVVVARLYDRDRTARPWEQMARLGWSRQRLQSMFTPYQTREIGRVDDVVLRELVARPAPRP